MKDLCLKGELIRLCIDDFQEGELASQSREPIINTSYA